MSPQNPAIHTRTGARATTRAVDAVRAGRAAWAHPAVARTGVQDLADVAGAVAAAVQQLAAALAQMPQHQTPQTMAALHQGGQAAAAAEIHLRTALRSLRSK